MLKGRKGGVGKTGFQSGDANSNGRVNLRYYVPQHGGTIIVCCTICFDPSEGRAFEHEGGK